MFGFSSFEPKCRLEATRSRAIVPATVAVALIAAFLASCRDKSPLAPVEEESLSLEVAAERSVQERPQVVPGQYIITFRDQAQLPPGIVRQLSEQYGLAARHTFENVFSGFSAQVPEAALSGLRNHPLIASVQPVGVFYLPGAPPSPPADVPTDGLRLRLVASELGLADGAAVEVWPNLGGSEGGAIQTDKKKQPTFHAAGATGKFGGHAHVGFNEGESDEFLDVTEVTAHGSATVVAVFSQDDKASHNYGLMAIYQNQRNRGTFATMYAGSGDLLGYWDPSIGWHKSTFSPTVGQEHVAVWRIDGSNTLDFQVDGVDEGSVPITRDIHAPFTRYLIGAAEPKAKNWFSGQVAEVVVYDRALADCERDQVVAELGVQYGIDVGSVGSGACGPPAAPTDLTATAVDQGTIELGWTDASGDEDGFKVERRQGSEGSFELLVEVGANVTAYTDRGLLSGTEYCYRVAAFSSAEGTSAFTPVQCATTATPPPPPPPVDVPTNGLRLRLVASELGLADGAAVDVWPNLGGSETGAIQTDAGKQPTFHAAGATGKFEGHAHVGFNEGTSDEFLDVTGVAAHGSATVVAVFSQDDKLPHSYGLMAVYEDGSNRGTFATMYAGSGDLLGYWDPSIGWHKSTFSPTVGQEHVAVWRIDGSNTLDFQVDGVDEGSVSITSDIHAPFSRYLIGASEPTGVNWFTGQVAEVVVYERALLDCERDQVVAELGAQYGIDVGSVGSAACNPPAAPTDLTATALDHGNIELGWTDASSDEDGFRVERRQGPGGSFEFLAEVGANVTAYTDAGLISETEYCYRVAAFISTDGTSAFTPEQCATTAAVPPPPPPVDVPSNGLRLRLVASELGLADGAAVDVWPNLGGSEGAANQTDAGKQPTYHAAGATGKFGGHAHVGFNEGTSDEFLDVTGVTAHGSATVVAVFSQDDKALHSYGLMAVYQDGSNRGTFSTMYSGSGDLLGYWDPSVGWHKSTFSPTVGQEHVAVWRIDGSNTLDFQVDGVDEGSVSITSDIHAPFSRYLIGASEPTGVNWFTGQVAEVVVYERALLDCERDEVVAELGLQYGIDVGSVGSGACNPPAPPTDLTATAVDHRTIELGWTDASGDEDGFRVERRQGPGGSFEFLAEVGANVTAYTDVGLISGAEYCYRVAAFSSTDGTSAFTPGQCATTASAPPPPPPADLPSDGLRLRLVASELGLADGAAVDVWPNLGGSEGAANQTDAGKQPTFHAMGATGKFGGHAHVGFNEGTSDEFLDVTGVTAHGSATVVAVFSQDDKTSHSYGLMAVYQDGSNRGTFSTMYSGSGDLLGYWDPSIGWHKSTFSPTAGQDYVAVWRIDGSNTLDFQVDGVDEGSVSITSDIHAPFSRYLIGASEPTGVNWFSGQVAEVVVYDRALLDCERDEVVAELGLQYGIDVGSVGSGACNPPAPPTDLTATAVDYRTIDLAWTDASGDEDGFRVERRQGSEGPFEFLAEVGADVTAYTDVGLFLETEHCYRVAAFSSTDGASAFSEIACATPPPPPQGACFDTGSHDDLGNLWNIQRIQAEQNIHWQATQVPGCEIQSWIFTLDSGVDSDHPDLNVAEASNFVLAEGNRDGEDGHGHGTHVAGTAAAKDGNGGVVGVAPGAPIFSFRVCSDDGSCQEDDILAAMEEVLARKLANPGQPMVGNMSLGGSPAAAIDTALRASVNAGIVYAVAAGNGMLGMCLIPGDAQNASPARVGDDAINEANGSDGNTARINGVLTTTLSNASDADGNCNYGAPVTIAAPGDGIFSTWLNGGYNTIGGTSMASPHVAGAAALYLQEFPDATPAEVEAWILSQLDPWVTDDLPNADGRLNVRRQ